MGRLDRFEDIAAWKKARELTREVYQVTASGEFTRDFALRDQMRRAAVSIGSNIAEGFGRGGDNEFRQFLAHAKGSVCEVKSQLHTASDAGYLTAEQFTQLYGLADETERLISGFLRYLASSTLRGHKFREDAIEYAAQP